MMLHAIAAVVLTALEGYLLGSILFGVLVSRLLYKEDVRTHGSGNAGMTNVLRTYGAMPAVLTIVGDVGKSVAAAFLGRLLFAVLLGPDAVGATFSAVAVAPGTRVDERGMRWELEDKPMELLGDLGISNVVTSPGAEVACRAGAVAAFLLRTTKTPQ